MSCEKEGGNFPYAYEREGSYLASCLEPFDLCEHGGELSLAHLLVLLLGHTGVGPAGTGDRHQVALVLHLLGEKGGLGRREGGKQRGVECFGGMEV